MKTEHSSDVAIIGAGIAGIAAAYFLLQENSELSVLLIDRDQPMNFTSAQSGDNYRNWWPHPIMTAFTNDSIKLMESLASSSNVINMTRRGYLLASRRPDISELVTDLYTGYGSEKEVRLHTSESVPSYQPALSPDWQSAPDGVDVLMNEHLVRRYFPNLDSSVSNVIHIRRAGDFSGQQMGQFMLEKIKAAGGRRLTAEVLDIQREQDYRLELRTATETRTLRTEQLVIAAGPYTTDLSAMLGINLPIENTFQQKIAFEDTRAVVPRQQPFAIDLDEAKLEWSADEQDWLRSEPELSWLTNRIVGGIHCRPEGGDNARWLKLGWAYNTTISEPKDKWIDEPQFDQQFPEIVMRGASILQPSLRPYVSDFPSRFSHYGGYYSMTKENWPLIGPLDGSGAFVLGALSGFGSMASCGAGSLIAKQITNKDLPVYAHNLGLGRYSDAHLMNELANSPSRGIL
ncbi:MAG: NAD(P)/FAD-dependent oxidoreductase [Pseudomonadales bacterium]